MENSKLVSVLKKLNKDEFKDFGKFVSSPYFSKGRDCSALLEALKHCWPDFIGEKITKKAVYERMQPNEKFDDDKAYSLLATLSTELYKMVLEYLRYSEFEKDEVQKKLMLLRGLRSKNQKKEFEKEFSRDNNENPVTRGSSESFLESSLMNTVYSNYLWDRGLAEKMCYANLNSSADALAYALITAFKYMDTKSSAKYIDIHLPRSFNDIVLESIDGEKMLNAMKDENDPMLPYISANYYIYMMKRFPAERKYYDLLKETLYTNIDKFGHTEKYMLHQALQTYVTIGLESNEYSEVNVRELFELYKNSLELGAYKISPDAYLEPTVYRNIFITACDVKEYEWAEEFINKYSHELQAEFAEGTRDYALASVYFNKGEFSNALKKIMNISYDYPLHKLDSKVLHFKICWELGQIEQSYNLLDTTKHYLSTAANLPGIYRKKNLNFVKYAAELLKHKSGKARDIGFTLDKLIKEEPIKSKAWLMDKFNELGI